tara:strand:+ start:74 stop:247 length:174 start_codon:yes stop_codon:yes gene_type:complete
MAKVKFQVFIQMTLYLNSRLTTNYDGVGGNMALVVENLSKLSNEELMLIASYIKSVK